MVKGVSAPFFEAADLKQARVGEQTYLGIKKELSKAQTVRTLSYIIKFWDVADH